ncbi:MAG: cation:proton antiporter [Clostridia bacterium]
MTDVLRVFAIICIALIVGKIVAKIKLPSILGWLITGMVFGPYLVGIVSETIIAQTWYKCAVNLFECFAGLMIGTEIIFKKLKAYGKQIIVITLFQSLGTFLIVSLAFAVALYIAKLPLFLAFIFGGIALATAPAPALSIVNEFKTKGAVTRTLIPMAALDDVVGVCVFFTVISIVSSMVSADTVSVWSIILIVLMPFIIGIAVGAIAGFALKKQLKPFATLLILISMILICVGIGFICDFFIFKKTSSLNYILLGMAFSATFANIVGEERLKSIMQAFNPILNISLVIVIVNLGMPLNYKLIAGAGVFTLVYILSRAVGKIGGAFVGSVVTKADPNIKKYLGLTLLPHSGVSLVFTGIAVSTLAGVMPECAVVIQGTIAAAAIINEIIAVILAKQAFKWAGELNAGETNDIKV